MSLFHDREKEIKERKKKKPKKERDGVEVGTVYTFCHFHGFLASSIAFVIDYQTRAVSNSHSRCFRIHKCFTMFVIPSSVSSCTVVLLLDIVSGLCYLHFSPWALKKLLVVCDDINTYILLDVCACIYVFSMNAHLASIS